MTGGRDRLGPQPGFDAGRHRPPRQGGVGHFLLRWGLMFLRLACADATIPSPLSAVRYGPFRGHIHDVTANFENSTNFLSEVRVRSALTLQGTKIAMNRGRVSRIAVAFCEESAMPDGTRKRRFSSNPNRRRWYSQHRARRFACRLGFGVRAEIDIDRSVAPRRHAAHI